MCDPYIEATGSLNFNLCRTGSVLRVTVRKFGRQSVGIVKMHGI